MEGPEDKQCTQRPTLCMLQIESYAKQKGLQLIGYYHANERFDDTELSSSARKIADKLYANNPLSCAVLVRLPRCKLAQPQASDTATMLTSYFTAAEHTKLGSISTRTRRHTSSGKYLFCTKMHVMASNTLAACQIQDKTVCCSYIKKSLGGTGPRHHHQPV